MIKLVKCPYCGEELKPRPGKSEINSRRKFCDRTCQTRYNTLKNYHTKYKYDKKRIRQAKKYTQEWYQKNKERQSKNLLKNYYANKGKWLERSYAERHKEEILEIIGKNCVKCGNPNVEIHHLTYDVPSRDHLQPKNRKGLSRGKLREMVKEYLKEYCKYLEPRCLECHKSIKPSYRNTSKLFLNPSKKD